MSARPNAANLQKELIDTYEQASRAWLKRVNSEIALWSELVTKLSATRSIPEALEIYQKCAAQRLQMAVEDGQRLSDECQRITQKITQAEAQQIVAWKDMKTTDERPGVCGAKNG
jgi:hypothetical protein